jgi:hypothetical protein
MSYDHGICMLCRGCGCCSEKELVIRDLETKLSRLQPVVDAAKEIRFVGNGKGHECAEPKRGGALARLRVALKATEVKS